MQIVCKRADASKFYSKPCTVLAALQASSHSDLERLHQFAVFFAYFHHFRYLKVVQLLQNCAKTFHFVTVLGRQKLFEDRPSRLNLAFIALE